MTKKKKTQKIQTVRKFTLLHTQGQEDFIASSYMEAKVQMLDFLLQRGMTWKRDKKDVFEVSV